MSAVIKYILLFGAMFLSGSICAFLMFLNYIKQENRKAKYRDGKTSK